MFQALDAKREKRKLKTSLSKLKILLKKLRSNVSIGECKSRNLASEGATLGNYFEYVLKKPPNQLSYKQCIAKCLFNRLRPEIPKNYLPVFDADFRKEPINCNLRYTWFAAEKFCRSKGLVLPAFDSKLKITQLLLFVNSLVASSRIMSMTANSPFRVWAGGMSVNDNSYSWTDTGEQIESDIFSAVNTTTGSNQKCIFVEIKGENNTNYTWKKGDCDSTNRFICEVPKLCFFEKCKTKSQMRSLMSKEKFIVKCVPNPCPVCTKLKLIGSIYNELTQSVLEAMEDNIRRFFNLNGLLYFASDETMTMDAAFSYCCKIQMNLWTWKSPTDGSQMVQILQSIGYNTNRTSVFVNARDEKCDENFVWCDKQKRAFGAEYGWIEDEPTDIFGNEVCVKFVILDGRPAGFSDERCNVKQYFICESQEPTDLVNTYQKVQKDPPVFQLKIECKEKSRCVKKAYWDAFEHCCSMGMHMATIDTREELVNVESMHYRNLTFKEFINQRIMLISSFYTTKNGSFWCSNDRPIDLNSIPMCLNEPDNAFPPETVLCYFNLRSDICLGDFNTLTPWHYVCQSP
ncbi:uncharacterized protein LOC135945256 [Cloeon dipterum]|uniref:uncharacterized protein LOC135945256 n=1 Tax=Cloeon dipterum TaxID=197152 RepID=UPI00322086C5